MSKITIVGGGLAGSEAAWQIAKRGHDVRIYEMRPVTMTPAHKTEHLAELVCSNSFRASNIENAVGLLKEEMRRLDSLIMKAADATAVPAGGCLAVDRNAFSAMIEEELLATGRVEIVREEIKDIPDDEIVIIASGPLTAESLAEKLADLAGRALGAGRSTAGAGCFIHNDAAGCADVIVLIVLLQPFTARNMSRAGGISKRAALSITGRGISIVVIRPIMRMLCWFLGPFLRLYKKRSANADASHQHDDECGSQKLFHGDSLSVCKDFCLLRAHTRVTGFHLA
jgi:hypothetical protein